MLGVLAYGVIMLVAVGLNLTLNAELPVLRADYDPWAFVSNWFLTAFAEELLFAGVLFTLFSRLFPAGRRWWVVVIVALLFALWHLPGYLAIGYGGSALAGRLGLNLASWLIFGTIYLLSGNLWLVVIAHAATNYGLSPLVTSEPLFGLLFMMVLLLGAWWLGSRREGRSLHLLKAAGVQPTRKNA